MFASQKLGKEFYVANASHLIHKLPFDVLRCSPVRQIVATRDGINNKVFFKSHTSYVHTCSVTLIVTSKKEKSQVGITRIKE